MRILTCIFSYNTKSFTERILNEFSKSDDHDIIVVDNSSIKEQIPLCENLRYLGEINVEFGGMMDSVLTDTELLNKYEFIGFLNNDTFGWSNDHIIKMRQIVNESIGIYHHSISPEYDKSARTLWPHTNTLRYVNEIENVAPYYNTNLLKTFSKYCPVQKHGLIDVAISGVCRDINLKQVIDDRISIHHMRSGTRKEVGSYNNYINTAGIDLERWQVQFPELRKYNLHQ